MTSNRRLLSFLFFIILACTALGSQVSDHTYAELELPQQPTPGENITLTPDQSVFAHWQYPNTWDVTQLLSKSLDSELPLPKISNLDSSISFVKDKVSQFLKLSDKAELLAQNIKQLPTMKHNQLLTVSEDEFRVLEEQESVLSGINNEIDQKGVELQRIVEDLMVKQENPLFKQAALNFEKKALLKKIGLFQDLQSRAISDKSKAENGDDQERVKRYFNELQQIFSSESGFIEQIYNLLITHNELSILKARITSLTSQLYAHQYDLNETQECARKLQQIKARQFRDKEAIQLMETLKKKKLQETGPNKYCEGVVQKLIQRVKKIMVGYDYVFECVRELEVIKANKGKIEVELEEAKKKLSQLQLEKGVEAFKNKFQGNRELIVGKVKELKGFKLSEFYMHPETIGNGIAQAKSRISEIDELIANLPVKSDHDFHEIQQRIRQKVNQIKTLKSKYCQQNQIYIKNAELIENKLIKLQQQEHYNTWVKKVLLQKFEELQKVKAQMKSLRQQIDLHLLNQTSA